MPRRPGRRWGPVEDRFWSQVDGADALGCWMWLGRLNSAGYGQFFAEGRYQGAHRWAYEHLRAPIGVGLTIDHECSNHPCVNPWHLDQVPLYDNVRRISQRGPWRSLCASAASRGKPQYQQLVEHLSQRIATGHLRPGARLPSTQALRTEYDVSYGTLRSALIILMSEGWIEGRQGEGRYVTEKPPA